MKKINGCKYSPGVYLISLPRLGSELEIFFGCFCYFSLHLLLSYSCSPILFFDPAENYISLMTLKKVIFLHRCLILAVPLMFILWLPRLECIQTAFRVSKALTNVIARFKKCKELLEYQNNLLLRDIWWSIFYSIFKCCSFFQHQYWLICGSLRQMFSSNVI